MAPTGIKTTQSVAEKWLNDRAKHITIVKWGGKAKLKSVFLDNRFDKQFFLLFSTVKTKISKNKDYIFTRTMEEIVELREKTCLRKHGTKNPSSSPLINEKKRQTCLKNSGYENPLLNPSARQKGINTMIEKYGVKHMSHIPGMQEKIMTSKAVKGITYFVDGKTLKEIAYDTQRAYSTLQQHYKNYGEEYIVNYLPDRSSLEQRMKEMLTSMSCSFLERQKLGRYVPDFLLTENQLVIECDGLYWHSDSRKIDSSYHVKKQTEYKLFGMRSLFFRENEILEKPDIVAGIVKNKLGTSSKIYARKLSITKLEKQKAKEYFKNNHLAGCGSGDTYALSENGVVYLACQVKWKNRKDNIMEISRLCSKNTYSVIGGFSRLIKHIINIHNPSLMTIDIDKRYEDGTFLKSMGWTKAQEQKSFSWTNHRKVLRRSKYPGNSGYKHGFHKLWDCGHVKWKLALDARICPKPA